MKRLALIPFAIALFAALFPSGALAKGASEARIEGPRLDDAITLSSSRELGEIAQASGFYVSVSRHVPDPALSRRPQEELGPRYTITYRMPGPYGEVDNIQQDVYPYAERRPVTYLPAGQRLFRGRETVGGWYVARTNLKDILVGVGLPRTASTGPDGSALQWTVVGALAALAALAAGVLGGRVFRRRPGTATAT